jgi:mannose-1-phosphate guanylyltransferase / phosphomannomutase
VGEKGRTGLVIIPRGRWRGTPHDKRPPVVWRIHEWIPDDDLGDGLMKSSVRAMVMAAGAGTRLRPLTQDVPKPMVPIANRPVLEYTLENLRRHGITEIILNLHNHPDLIRNHFGDGAAWGVHLRYSHELQLLGTAGGVKKAEEFLKQGTFLVMSGDGLTNINLRSLLAFHARKKAFGTMAVKSLDVHFEYGVTLAKADGRITRFIEKPQWSDVFSSEVNTGIYVFEPEALAWIPPGKVYDFGHELWPLLLKKKKPIFAYRMKEYWCDVGNLSEYRRAQRDALSGAAGIRLSGRQIQPGVWIAEDTHLESGVKLEGPCLVGRNCRLGRDSHVGAYTVIGEGARIGSRARLRQCTLWNHVQVGDDVTLENCIISHHARVHENVTVYEGTVINISE